MGSSPHVEDQPTPFQKELLDQLAKDKTQAQQESLRKAQEELGSVNLDWLREYGQMSANVISGVGVPFSGVWTGFSAPFMKPSGQALPLTAVR